jgi:hypothetical protein
MSDTITIGMDLGDLENDIVVMDGEGTEIKVVGVGEGLGLETDE